MNRIMLLTASGAVCLLVCRPSYGQPIVLTSLDPVASWVATVGLATVTAFAREAAKEDSAFTPLSPDDNGLQPQNPPGSPQVPSHCRTADGGYADECANCGFRSVHTALANNRQRFEKLRRINAATKSYVARQLAFGDSLSSALGLLGWPKARREIELSVKGFDAQYDAKHAELTNDLEDILRRMAACEEQVFGEKDWYDRYGFIYHQFVVTAYRRP